MVGGAGLVAKKSKTRVDTLDVCIKFRNTEQRLLYDHEAICEFCNCVCVCVCENVVRCG